MILVIECLAACIIFGVGVTVSIFINRTLWLHEYPAEVRERFLERNPEFREKREKSGGKGLFFGRIIVVIVFLLIITALGYLAGARTWLSGFLYCYLIWFVVNLFDVLALDLGLFMYWKKIRLPGTEDMDEFYTGNKGQHVKEGFVGVLIGLPICALAGTIICFLQKLGE